MKSTSQLDELRKAEITGRIKRRFHVPDRLDYIKKLVGAVINRDYAWIDELDGPITDVIRNIHRWDTSRVTSMRKLFRQVRTDAPEQTVDLSKWNTSSVTDMSSMFANLPPQVRVTGIGAWDTSKVTDMSYMVYRSYGVEVLSSFERRADGKLVHYSNLSRWDTSKVENMYKMFAGLMGEMTLDKHAVSSIVADWNKSSVLPGKEYNAEDIESDARWEKWHSVARAERAEHSAHTVALYTQEEEEERPKQRKRLRKMSEV
jgi:hypothetical protein